MFRKRVIFLLISFYCLICAQAKTYVVCVGISNYQNIPSLKLPEKDAATISEVYKASGGVVEIVVGKNATKKNIIKTLQSQFAHANAEDQIVLFFSGHGYQGGICPYDMKQRDISSGISYKEIKAILKQSKANQKIIIADACFSGGLRDSKQNRSVQNDGDKSVILFLSSRGGETSIESPLMANGIFTTVLSRGLRGGADTNRDKLISAKEIFTFVSQGVKERTKEKQHPVMWGSFNDSFVLMDWR